MRPRSHSRRHKLARIAHIWERKEQLSIQLYDAIWKAAHRPGGTTSTDEPRQTFPVLAVALKQMSRFFGEFVRPLYRAYRADPSAFEAFCQMQKGSVNTESPEWWVTQYAKLREDLPVPVETLLARGASKTRTYGRKIASDQVAADIGIILSRGLEASLREKAADRLTRHVSGRPILGKRWNAYQRQLRTAIIDLASTYQEETRRAVFLVSPDLAYEIFEKGEESLRALRRHLNDCVTESVLGPGWRGSRLKNAREPVIPIRPNPLAAAEARLVIERLISKSHLTARQAQVFEELLKGERLSEIPPRLGIKPPTVRVLYSRGLKKLQSQAQKLRKHPPSSPRL